MQVRAVFFDVGETLVDEERIWGEVARAAGLQPHVVFAALGVTIERGEDHWALWDHLSVERPLGVWERFGYDWIDLYPDAVAHVGDLARIDAGRRDRHRLARRASRGVLGPRVEFGC